jgi:hypothetical protein
MAEPLQKIIFNALTDEQRVRFDAKRVDPDNLLFDHDYAPKIVSKTTPAPEVLHKSETNKIITYTLDTSKHYATRAVLQNILPDLAVKPKYHGQIEIRWPPLPALAGFTKAHMQIGENDKFPAWTRAYFDVCPSFADKDSNLVMQREAGNVPYLTKWNSELPRYEVTIVQPFFEGQPFPLHYAQGSSVTLVYEWNRAIRSCIMMRKLVKGEWKVIRPKKKYLLGSLTHIESPEIWVCYDAVDPDVLEKERSCLKVGSPEYRYFRASALLTDPNQKTFGDTSTISLSTDAQALAVFAFCRNQAAYRLNNPANFTTDAFTVDGFSPIRSVSVSHGDGGVVHFEGMTPKTAKLLFEKRFNSVPEHNNIFAFPFAQRPFSNDVEFGPNTNISKGQISIKVGDGDFNRSTNESDSEEEESDPETSNEESDSDESDEDNKSVAESSTSQRRYKSRKPKAVAVPQPKFDVQVIMLTLQRYMIHRKSDDKFMITFSGDLKN